MIPVDAQTMREVAPHFSGELADHQAKIIAAVGEVLASTLDEYEINTPLRAAHFLGQTCHESAGFRTTEEFASGADYEGRKDLGNTKPGDGVRYKGRGLIQLTGRANYKTYGKALGIDLENDPLRAADPVLSLRIACEYWKAKKINAACDNDDLIAVTRLINGLLNGLDDRRTYTTKAKNAIARLLGIQLSGQQGDSDHPILRRGSKGDDVVQLQKLLAQAGFALGIDGDFGAGTEVAVKSLQSDNGVDADGIVGDQTWKILLAATTKKTNS